MKNNFKDAKQLSKACIESKLIGIFKSKKMITTKKSCKKYMQIHSTFTNQRLFYSKIILFYYLKFF